MREWFWRALVVLAFMAAFGLAGLFACRIISLEDAHHIEKGPGR